MPLVIIVTNNEETFSGELEIIDASGKIVLPGFINTHSHIAMSIFRETLDGYNLQDWLSKKIWPMESKLTGDDISQGKIMSTIAGGEKNEG